MKMGKTKSAKKKPSPRIVAVPRPGLPPVLLLPLEGKFKREEIRKAVRAVQDRRMANGSL